MTAGNNDERSILTRGGVIGLSAMALMVASLPMAPPWPPAEASTDLVIAYFRDNTSGFYRQAWTANAGVVLLVLWGAAWHRVLDGRGHPLAAAGVLASLIIFVGVFTAFWMPWIVIAFRPELPPDTVQGLYDLGLLGQFIGVGFPLALFFGSLAVGIFATRVVPRAAGMVAALGVPLNILLAACYARSGALSPSGPVGFASIGLFTLIVVATSILMIRAGRRTE
jgi:hypothetical protein